MLKTKNLRYKTDTKRAPDTNGIQGSISSLFGNLIKDWANPEITEIILQIRIILSVHIFLQEQLKSRLLSFLL